MADDVFVYQDEAAKIMSKRERFGLFDYMGVGKTATTIRSADRLHAMKGLVVCPGAVTENWLTQFIRFQTIPRKLKRIESVYDMVAWFRGYYDVAIISYDRVRNMASMFDKFKIIMEFMVLDEAHYIKNEKARVTKAILGHTVSGNDGIVKWAAHAWWVTATPAPNDLTDIWTWLRFSRLTTLSKIEFMNQYCISSSTRWGYRCKLKNGPMGERLRKLIADNSIARTAEDVGIYIPEVWLTKQILEGNVKQINDYLSDFPGLDSKIMEFAKEEKDMSELDDEHVTTLRRIIGEVKAIPYAKSLLNDLNSGLDKVVIFGHHRQPLLNIIGYLEKHHIKCVSILGGTNGHNRDTVIRSFNEDKKCRVFVGNHRAAGVGLNLQSQCSAVDVFESDWSPAVNAQSIKRVARFGQKENTKARFFLLNHWLEERVENVNIDKTRRVLALGLPSFM